MYLRAGPFFLLHFPYLWKYSRADRPSCRPSSGAPNREECGSWRPRWPDRACCWPLRTCSCCPARSARKKGVNGVMSRVRERERANELSRSSSFRLIWARFRRLKRDFNGTFTVSLFLSLSRTPLAFLLAALCDFFVRKKLIKMKKANLFRAHFFLPYIVYVPRLFCVYTRKTANRNADLHSTTKRCEVYFAAFAFLYS